MSDVTAAEAMAHAQAAHEKVEAHEDLCAERYAHIKTSIGDVKDSVTTITKILGWGGSIFATILLALVAFFGSRALNNNDAQLVALQAQVAYLQQAHPTR